VSPAPDGRAATEGAAGGAGPGPEIPFGYLDRWTARPGERLAAMISSSSPFRSSVVRLVHGDNSAAGPGRKEIPQHWYRPAGYPAVIQPLRPGSYAVSGPLALLDQALRIEVDVLFFPRSRPERRPGDRQDAPQTLAALAGRDGEPAATAALGADGRPELCVGGPGGPRRLALDGDGVMPPGRWYRLRLVLDRENAQATLEVSSVHAAPAGPRLWRCTVPLGDGDISYLTAVGTRPHRLLLAAAAEPGHGRAPGSAEFEFFNGKLEAPSVSGLAGGGLGGPRSFRYAWDFGTAIGAVTLSETVGHHAPLRLVNAPTAGVRGHNWTGRVLDFTAAPQQYAALAFHEDDLEDAGWDITAVIELPDELTSGAYALMLTSAAGTRYLPFFVAPRLGARRASIAVLFPTFTYLAYANEHVREQVDHFGGAEESRYPHLSRQDQEITAHREVGLSLYDSHADGTGVCYSSLLRPVLNFDPSYRFWLFGAPVHFGADLCLIDWLEHLGLPYDVITDHLLDAEGAGLLDGYRVVLTGSHPEYVSQTMLDALEGFVADGQRLMYLGGNGFYWVTSTDPRRPHLLEMRRGMAGGRTWESEPGETYHSTTGEPGGLWRHRGRPPNRLLGVGFSAQGDGSPAPGYRRVLGADASDQWDWVFGGVDPGATIGDFGLIMSGAAGNEIDRADPRRGSPPETVVLATSTGHGDEYQLAVEDLMLTAPGQGGTTQPLVRSDVVIVPHASGGRVFSVGAITWIGSLSWNGYRNSVCTITRNVLERFLEG
jgi:N,N-dimethylformamidase